MSTILELAMNDLVAKLAFLEATIPQTPSEKISKGVKIGNCKKRINEVAQQIAASKTNGVTNNASPTKVETAAKSSIPQGDVIERDAFDNMYFADLSSQSEKLQKLPNDDTEQNFVSDIFSSLYKHEPKVSQNAPNPQKSIIETMLNLQEYKDLRTSTELDEISSAIGTMQIGQSLLENLRKVVEEQQKEQGGDGQDGDGAPSEEQTDQIRRGLRKVLKKAQEEVENTQETMSLLFGDNDAELERTPFNTKLELAQKFANNKKFKKILDWYGRFANVVNAALANNYTHGYDEIVDITIGDSIQRILPSELIKLRTAKKLFYKDLLEGNLFMYDLKGIEPKAKGPMIVCLDVSGSMSGDREEWAQGVLFAMMLCASKQKRPFGVIAYNNTVRLAKFFPKASDIKIEDRVELFSLKSDGGTEFNSPLEEAFKMRSQCPDLKPADVIFITDGEAELSEKQIRNFEELKEKTGTKIHGIGILTGELKVLSKLLNSEILVKDFENIDVVKNLVNSAI